MDISPCGSMGIFQFFWGNIIFSPFRTIFTKDIFVPNALQKICKFFFAHLAFGMKNFTTIGFPMKNNRPMQKTRRFSDQPKVRKSNFSKTSGYMHYSSRAVGGETHQRTGVSRGEDVNILTDWEPLSGQSSSSLQQEIR